MKAADAAVYEVAPLVAEVRLALARLSLDGSEEMRAAAGRVNDAAAVLFGSLKGPSEATAENRKALNSALGQLRRARDMDAAPWWRRREMRPRLTAADRDRPSGRPSAPPASAGPAPAPGSGSPPG